MKELVYTSTVKCSLDNLFEFHTNTENIGKITPPNTKVILLNSDSLAYEGKKIKIKTTKYFISTYWEVIIDTYTPPNILIDVAVKSPFKQWRHQHIFTKKGSIAELKDIVEFEMPFGIFGKLLEPFIVKDINSMFQYRHLKTKEILEKQ